MTLQEMKLRGEDRQGPHQNIQHDAVLASCNHLSQYAQNGPVILCAGESACHATLLSLYG